MVEPDWSPPDTFEEYRLVRSLGHGAMGQVYLAHDSLLDRHVAVKFVHAAEDPKARERFFDEARAIARLQHPNVVAVYRVAEVAGHPYLVSEYVRGRPLDQIERPVPSQKVLALAIDLARGLAAAHRCGVLHRDVKPSNSMITDDGRAKLLDFGLATVVDSGTAEPAVAPPRERDSNPGIRTSAISSVDSTVTARHAVELVDSSAGAAANPSGSPSPVTVDRGHPFRHVEGTPLYLAPELWRGEPATRRSDLYALGILLYELLAGTAPRRGTPSAELGRVVQELDIPRLGEVVPGVEPALAAIVDRLVERDAGARFPSAEALVVALEDSAVSAPADDVPDGNPYRGLAPFESAHGSLFFGRRGEIRELVDRVRTEAFVVVGGDSGTGKSSLCRAGVLPWLAEHDGWSRVDVVPGRHPVQSLAAALAAWSGVDEAMLVSSLRDTPDSVARAIRKNVEGEPRRLLLFVDQLEELLTLSAPEEASVVAAALAALAVRTPSVRVLATARSDFLSRLARLPGLGDEMARGLYFLRPIAGDRIREVIVRPAAAKGVTFESEALIDALVAQTEQAPGGLPLLQFTLAELWDARDVAARTIRAETLATLGGVEGALTRHADRLLAGLAANERDAAHRLLLRLVTNEGTRARRSEAELLSDGPARGAERAALEALVRGRVVVANHAQTGTYEIAHEALLRSWSTLQDWLQRGAADHAVRRRVEQAAAEWEQMGRPRDLLWGRRQLAEANTLDRDSLAPREVAYLAAGRRAIRARALLAAGAVAIVATGVAVVGVTIRARARQELDAVIDNQIAAATTAMAKAHELSAERDNTRDHAYALFDAHRWPAGEDTWTRVEELAAAEGSQYRAASSHFETALALDPTRASSREQFADLIFERLLRAEQDRRGDLVDELAGRLLAYDDGRHHRQLDADARVELVVSPPGTRVWQERAGGPRELVGDAPVVPFTLRPGELVLSFEAPARAPVRLPVLLSHGKTVKLAVALPAAELVPAGMVYVPAGAFLFGSADSSDLRRGFLNSPPMHEVTTGAYLVGRHEVTFADWIEYLDELPVDERRRRTPNALLPQASLALAEIAPRRWQLTFKPTSQAYIAETGQRLRYGHRDRRVEQDWTKFPVSAVSFEDATAYAAWLDRTKRLPGARLCDEYEWERAARGADGRTFPSGATLAADDANIDITYGRDPLGFGPDEVGSHMQSRSPFGVDDMAGNVWEWTRSVESADMPIARGGGYYNGELSARSINREPGEPTQRHVWIGVRLCATPSNRAP